VRLRAREDGEKPSPLRDCEAEEVGHASLLRAVGLRARRRSGKAMPRGMPLSQETDGDSIPD